jgi:drug/metabolite transporter (DMT)-like permease
MPSTADDAPGAAAERRSETSRRNKGLALALVAMLSVPADGLLLKLAFARGSSPASAAIFKYGSSSAAMAAFLAALAWRDRYALPKGAPPMLPMPSRLGWKYVLGSSVLNVWLELSYTLGFAFTSSANVLAFASIAPVWAALMSWPVFGVFVPRRTLLACGAALAGSITIAIGYDIGAALSVAERTRASAGLAFAISTGFAAAAQLTTIQAASVHAPETNMLAAHGIGVFNTMVVGFALIPVLHPPGEPLAPDAASVGFLFLNGALCSALAISALTLACRFIPATEVSLLLQVEGLLGPLSTYLVLDEVPARLTLIGGSVVIAAVTMHEAVALAEERGCVRKRGGQGAGAGVVDVAAEDRGTLARA